MKAFKVNSDTVAALIPRDELSQSSVLSVARKAFSAIGEPHSQPLDITAYANGASVLIFAAKKRKKCFDVTKHYRSCRQ